MKNFVSLTLTLGLVLVMDMACAPATRPEARSAAAPPISGEVCVGSIAAPPDAVEVPEDSALLREALDLRGKGKLCSGKVFEARGEVTVYRVWDSARAYTEFGRWWSFTRPSGPVATYREQNAICPEWSALDMVSVCTLKVGARFVVGPGQSARCDGGVEYPQSAVNQVYIPNDTRAGKVYVEGCRQLGAFP